MRRDWCARFSTTALAYRTKPKGGAKSRAASKLPKGGNLAAGSRLNASPPFPSGLQRARRGKNEHLLESNRLSLLLNPARQHPKARRLRREVHLHIGPTNSGKSHAALQAFKSAKSGYYAGPLRMLAREVYERMEAEGIPCNLITGDEIMEKEGAELNSGTVEMVDTSKEMDVAVIDEIQMISDRNRGWAWTRALLGVRARHVHLCGDPNSEQIVSRILEETGDILHVHRYERLSPLKVMDSPLPKKKGKPAFTDLKPGDCIVSFSKNKVQKMRDNIVQAHRGEMCCSIIYGSLPPETRAQQAQQFNEAKNGVRFLVASDAIGMGLNLGIKRIIFSTLKKFDGREMRNLDTSEIKQIAGRAGRFKTASGTREAEVGLVTAMDAKDISRIKEALAQPTPIIQQAVLMPPSSLVRSALFDSNVKELQMGSHTLFSEVLRCVLFQNRFGKNYCKPHWERCTEVARTFDRVRNLTIEDRLLLANAPVPLSMPIVNSAFEEMCFVVSRGASMNALELFPSLMNRLGEKEVDGATLEALHKVLTLFLWLSYRFPCNFVDRAGATELKKLCEYRFAHLLRNSRRKLAARS